MASGTETESTKLPPYVEHQLVHYKQRYNWDCGVSCVIMLLEPEQREELLGSFQQLCEEEGFKQSTWTIDLCYLLKRYGIKHIMYTTMMGVNEEYRRQSYYSRIMDLDRERVQGRFASAPVDGILVKHAQLPTRDMMQHVARHGPALVLVDAGLLVCRLCKHNKLRSEFRRCFGGSYRGHYILVSGLLSHDPKDTKHRETRALYHDPALTSRVCCVSLARLDEARRATGTDCDVILVFKDFRMLMGLPRFCSASGMFAEARVDGFTTILRKRTASLMRRVRGSTNNILQLISGRLDTGV